MESEIKTRALARHGESAFSRRMLARLNDIEVRPVRFGEDREDLYRFRYRCYRASGHVAPLSSGMISDEHDEAPGAMLLGLWHNGQMVSSIRFNRATAGNRTGMSRLAFPDVVEPMLDDGATIIDPTRFTVCPQAKRELPQLPYVTVRLAAMASIHFDADYAFSLVRPTHGAFYQKIFGADLIGDERPCPGVDFKVCLYATHIENAFPHVFSQHPFFHSLPSERRMLFGPLEGPFASGEAGSRLPGRANAPSWLTVLPTAELALSA